MLQRFDALWFGARTWNDGGITNWPRGITTSPLDSESSDRGTNPREAFLHRASMDITAKAFHGSIDKASAKYVAHRPGEKGIGPMGSDWKHGGSSAYGSLKRVWLELLDSVS
jgi:hypothetical protein